MTAVLGRRVPQAAEAAGGAGRPGARHEAHAVARRAGPGLPGAVVAGRRMPTRHGGDVTVSLRLTAHAECGLECTPSPHESVTGNPRSAELDGQQGVDHRRQLFGRPAFVHGDDFLVAGHRRVAAAPQVLGLGVEPVRVPARVDHVRQQIGFRVAVVVAPVAEDQQGTARRQHVRLLLQERHERVAVVGVAVAGVHARFAGDALHGDGQVGVGAEQLGDLVGGVDEGEDANPGELLAQRVHQQQREVAETRHRTGHVAQHHQLGTGRMRLLQHHVDRHAAGGHRLAQRLAQVDLAGPRPPPPRGQPGRQRARQRCHHPAHLAQLLAGGAQELDVLGELRDAVHLHVVAAQLLGGAPLGLGLDHLAQLRDALGGKGFGDLLLRRRGLVAVRREQPGQQPALEIVEAHRLERLVRRVRRAAAGVVAAVGLDDLRDHRRQPLVDVGQIFVVGEHVERALRASPRCPPAAGPSSSASSSSSSRTVLAPSAAGKYRSNIAS